MEVDDVKSRPEDYVEFEYWEACKEVLDELAEKRLRYLKCLRLVAEPEIEERQKSPSTLDEKSLYFISQSLLDANYTPSYIRGIVVAHAPKKMR